MKTLVTFTLGTKLPCRERKVGSLSKEKLSDYRVPRAPMISDRELLEKPDKRFDAARHRRNSFERSSAFDAWRTWNVRAQARAS